VLYFKDGNSFDVSSQTSLSTVFLTFLPLGEVTVRGVLVEDDGTEHLTDGVIVEVKDDDDIDLNDLIDLAGESSDPEVTNQVNLLRTLCLRPVCTGLIALIPVVQTHSHIQSLTSTHAQPITNTIIHIIIRSDSDRFVSSTLSHLPASPDSFSPSHPPLSFCSRRVND